MVDTLTQPICGSEIPNFLGLDFSTAPTLLFYAYIPIVFFAICVSIFIYTQNPKTQSNNFLIIMIGFFVLWVVNVLLQWVASYHQVIITAWRMTAIFEFGLYVTAFMLSYAYLFKRIIKRRYKILYLISILIVIAISTTKLNIASYDIEKCEGIIGPLWNLIYCLEPTIILIISFIGLKSIWNKAPKSTVLQNIIFIIGIDVFLFTFFISNIYAEVMHNYEINLIGPIGMVVFMLLFSYNMIKDNFLSLKFFFIQLTIIILVSLTLSLLFLSDLRIIYIEIFFIISAILVFGYILTKFFSLSYNLEKKARRELEKLNETKDQFVSIAQHNLRIPITSINNRLNNIVSGKYGEINPEISKVLMEAIDSSNNLTNIANDFKDIAKLKTGSQILNLSTASLLPILESVLQELKIDIEQKKIRVSYPTNPNDWPIVHIDVNKIREVLIVIIENAIKYNIIGGTINISNIVEVNNLIITIENSGIGITTEEKENILNHSFYRSNRAKDINPTGMGIGLSVSRSVVEAHHGTLNIESKGRECGATVTVSLPLNFLLPTEV